jgi:hypothetical protein
VDNTANDLHFLRSLATFTGPAIRSWVTMSVYAKSAKSATPVLLLGLTGAFSGGGTYFDLTTGAIADEYEASDTTVQSTSSMESLGDGWWRCTVTARANQDFATSYLYIAPCPAAYTQNYVGDGTTSAYVYGAQVAFTNGDCPYVKTTSAAVPGPIRQLVATEQNLILGSEDFANTAYWTGYNATASANAVANPVDGAPNAAAIVDTSANDLHALYNATFTGPAINAWVTVTIYAKSAKSATPVLLISLSGAFLGGGTYFDLTSGVATDQLDATFEPISTMESLGNGALRDLSWVLGAPLGVG